MVTLENFVDGDVPRWNLGDDEPLGVDVHGIIVYHPDISARNFEKAVKSLGKRQQKRMDLTIRHARSTGSHLKIIDADTIAEAAASSDKVLGYDYLDRFISDTMEVASDEVGQAVRRARLRGVKVTPEHYTRGISVTPTRSFPDRVALELWETGRKASWRPSTRLDVRLSLDGPLAAVEASSEDIRRAISVCGPLKFFEEHARTASDAIVAVRPVLLAGAEPEICA